MTKVSSREALQYEAADFSGSSARNERLNRDERHSLVLEYRVKARKLARSFLRRWGVYLEAYLVDSMVDLSLCEAVVRFDPERGATFMTFMYYHLRGNLMRLIAESVNRSDLSQGRLAFEGDEGEITIGSEEVYWSLHSGEAQSPHEIVEGKEELKRCLDACDQLDTLGKDVIHRFYFDGEPVTSIAKSLGYSRSHISRVKTRALRVLGDAVGIELSEYNEDGDAVVPKHIEPKDDPFKVRRRRPRSKQARELQEYVRQSGLLKE
jgi:RNA polymerase sigma factor (sigma-70 family)